MGKTRSLPKIKGDILLHFDRAPDLLFTNAVLAVE
jgi:hypothetical protein